MFDDIKVNKGLECEFFICDIQVLADNLADFVPMVCIQVLVSQCINDGHGSCECLNTLFQFHLDVVGW